MVTNTTMHDEWEAIQIEYQAMKKVGLSPQMKAYIRGRLATLGNLSQYCAADLLPKIREMEKEVM